MNEPTPYVVDDRWVVYAKSTMEAALRYRAVLGAAHWPAVREAEPRDLARLPELILSRDRQAA